MPRNGTGTYSLPQAPFVPGTTILSSAVNSDLSDVASALTTSVCSDGQTSMTGTLKALAGSAASPGYAFVGSTNSGFFAAGSGNVGATVNGTLAATLTSTGWSGGTTATVPIGTVADFAGSTAPVLWILCFGQAVSRTTYSALFTTISTTYGVGDGSTTFNLPDCRGRAAVGKDNMGGSGANRMTTGGSGVDGTTLGANGGEQTHLLSTGEMPAHSHAVTDPQHTHAVNINANTASNGNSGGTRYLGSSGNIIFETTTNATNTVMNANASTGISLANTGGGGVHNNTQPTIIFNKIIFAGA